jgi:hypothetical protein
MLKDAAPEEMAAAARVASGEPLLALAVIAR